MKGHLVQPALSMATRLLSSLTQIEHAILKNSASNNGPTWEVSRMVNYHHGLARMTLTPPAGSDPSQARGAIFLQSYTLADGTLCFKVSLNWQGSDCFPVISIFTKPGLDWHAEAVRIAAAWLAGPTSSVTALTLAEEHLSPLASAVG
jgi:hypothetical protein